ncbi:hypothetical protein ACWGS9_14570 [Bradyrhizobium sp. Arg314]
MARLVMPTKRLSQTERELLAATAIAGVVGALPGTVEAWARDESISAPSLDGWKCGSVKSNEFDMGDTVVSAETAIET